MSVMRSGQLSSYLCCINWPWLWLAGFQYRWDDELIGCQVVILLAVLYQLTLAVARWFPIQVRQWAGYQVVTFLPFFCQLTLAVDHWFPVQVRQWVGHRRRSSSLSLLYQLTLAVDHWFPVQVRQWVDHRCWSSSLSLLYQLTQVSSTGETMSWPQVVIFLPFPFVSVDTGFQYRWDNVFTTGVDLPPFPFCINRHWFPVQVRQWVDYRCWSSSLSLLYQPTLVSSTGETMSWPQVLIFLPFPFVSADTSRGSLILTTG